MIRAKMFSPVAGRLQKENPSLRNDKTALYVTTENCAFPSIMAIKMIRKNLYKNLKILACFSKKFVHAPKYADYEDA
jgi:hypothetical protein